MGTNNGNHGVKGRSGRKGALVELNNAQILHDMFFGDQEKNETLEKLKTGKYSLKDVFVSKAYSGNERMLLALFNKNFPDAALKDWGVGDDPSAVSDSTHVPDAVKSIEDVMNLIEATINGVRSGSMSVQAAANVGRLASLALKAIEVGELDKKMDLVNSVIQERKMKAKK
jgi:hypothetical protein